MFPREVQAMRKSACRILSVSVLLAASAVQGAGSDEPEAHVARQLAQLESQNPADRAAAAEALGAIGTAARPAVQKLVQALHDDADEEVRRAAAKALGRVGYGSGRAIRGLAAALGDSAESVQLQVIRALGVHLHRQAGDAVPDLILASAPASGIVRARLRDAFIRVWPTRGTFGRLVALLDHENSEVRADAAWNLGRIHPPATGAVPHLVPVLEGQDVRVATAGAGALGEIGHAPEIVVPALIRAMGASKSAARRVSAAHALGAIGAPARQAVPALARALQDVEVQRAAARALERMGPAARDAVPQLITALGDDRIAGTSARALGAIGSAARPALPALEERLQDDSPGLRLWASVAVLQIAGSHPEAAQTLVTLATDEAHGQDGLAPLIISSMGSSARFVVPLLCKTLKNKDAKRRMLAAYALWPIVEFADGATAALAEALRDPVYEVRCFAADALARIGRGARAAEPALMQALEDEQLPEATVIDALGAIGCRTAAPALTARLDDAKIGVRVAAAHALAQTGPHAEKAVPGLARVLTDEMKDVPQEEKERAWHKAIVALAKIGPKARAAVPALAAVLGDDRSDERDWYVPEALAKIAPNDSRAAQALIRGLKHGVGHVRAKCAKALAEMQGPTESVVPALLGALEDPQPSVRESAARALGRIGRAPERGVPALAKLLDDWFGDGRLRAAEAIGNFGPAGAPALKALTQAVRTDEDWLVRAAAAAAIGKIGRADKTALAALAEARTDPFEDVRAAAAQALEALRAGAAERESK
jgi:HEAT repeat protein